MVLTLYMSRDARKAKYLSQIGLYGYRKKVRSTADLRLCFRKGKNPVFSWRGSYANTKARPASR